jgi:hypothetical protein
VRLRRPRAPGHHRAHGADRPGLADFPRPACE